MSIDADEKCSLLRPRNILQHHTNFAASVFLADDRCGLGYLVARETGGNLSGSPAKYAARARGGEQRI